MTTPSRASAAGRGGASSAALGSAVGSGSTFFHQERERLITDIADSMETLLGNVNTLNRKLEESIAVGQEFEPIANLWGPFVDILTASGLSTSQRQAQTSSAAAAPTASRAPSTHEPHASQYSDELVLSSEGAVENTLPPDVAPGGGQVYGQERA